MHRRSLYTHLVVASILGAAVALVAACGGSSSNSSSDPGSACDAYFDALSSATAKCDGVSLPADLAAAQKARFHTLCVQQLGLNGSGLGTQTLNDCASAFGAVTCHGANPAISSCAAKTGTLADGSTCNSGTQCKGGLCTKTASVGDGGVTIPTCGTCSTGIAVGASCANGGNCMPGSACTSNVCVADGTVDVGGDCGNNSVVCKSGLACSASKCTLLAAENGPCNGTQSCQDGLVCVKNVCTKGLVTGADCSTATSSCLSSVCDPTTKKCAQVTLAHAGEPCGFVNGTVVACAQGSCNTTMQTTGTCPKVLADGAACSFQDRTTTCDFFSNCTNGVCTFGETVCK